MYSPKSKATFLQTLKAVLWSFFGVRKGKDHDTDMATLNPVHVILAGIGAALVFIFTLILIVRLVLKYAVN
jgi:hypothetical protein